MSDVPENGPSPVDIHVGSAIRTRRKLLNMSQERLAELIGLTFQQVQKYEKGANRVSASKLYHIAKALDCKPGDLFPEDEADLPSGRACETLIDRAYKIDGSNGNILPKLARCSQKQLNQLEPIITAMAAANLVVIEAEPLVEAA